MKDWIPIALLWIPAILAAATCAPSRPSASAPVVNYCGQAEAAARALVPELGTVAILHTRRAPRAGGFEYRGRRIIAVNPAYLETAAAAYGEGAAVGVCAHELGHLPPIRGAFAPPSEESEAYADAFAGCSLALLGLEVDGYAELLELEASAHRARAARQGWALCDEQIPR